MKTNPQIFAVLISSILFLSCGNDDDNVDVDPDPINADSFASINELIDELKPNTQTFTIDPTTNQIVTGTEGTEVTINANALTDDQNNPITTPITVKLREHLTLADMILANAQTVSNGQLLVTGGNFNLTFEDENGNTVNANPWGISAVIPVQTNIVGYENSMQYYVGNTTIVDGREVVNWDLATNAEAWFSDGLFNIFGLEQGLSNCDVLYDMAGDSPTQFEVTVSDVTDYENTTVWMVIEDFPSVVMLTQQNNSNTALKTYDNSIPTGLNATLIAMTVDEDDYLKFGSLPITVQGDDTFNVVVDYGTTEELTALIQSIAN